MDIPRTIWFMWLQGLEQAPMVVRECYDSWVARNPGWNVVLFDRDNIESYWSAGSTLGRDLARVYESPLLVLVAGEDKAALAQREAEAGRWLAASGTAGVMQRITAQESKGIGRLLCEVDAGLVVVDQRAAIGGRLDLDVLAEQTRASIVVLGLG